MVYELIKFEQALANEKIIRLCFTRNDSPFTKECLTTELGKIQRLYALWNGNLINQDFDNLFDVVKFLNETMVRERLCKMNGRVVVECYAPIIAERPASEVVTVKKAPFQYILDETTVGEVYRWKELDRIAMTRCYYLSCNNKIFRQHFRRTMHGSYRRIL